MPSHGREKIFVSYSHKDTPDLEALKTLLMPKIRDGTISFWDDALIEPGNKWRENIDEELSSATIALLLVSDHYFASDFIVDSEFIPILDRAKNDGLRVYWMLLRPCLWEKTKIKEYQALHDTNKPLSKLTPDERQEELIKICNKIVKMVEEGRPAVGTSLIRGWYPYNYEDKDIFADLQRQGFVDECVSGICHDEFRFGLLQGESGVGKTSTLQAGLGPRLKERGYDYKYIDLRNESPPLLQKLTPQKSKPLVLLLDHFEKAPIQPHDEFFQALVSWCGDTSIPPVKMLASVETGFVGEMQPFFTHIQFKYHPQQSFLLSKLSKEEALKIVRLMADREKIPFESDFVDCLIEKSVSNAKEEVSPVVLQITAHTIRLSRRSDKELAFTKQAIEKMGGIEGIYERVLEEQLQKLESERRHIAEEILKTLIDWEKRARSSALTREEIKDKILARQTTRKTQDHPRSIEMRDLSVQKLAPTLAQLCTWRFIRMSHRRGVDTYELDQDWLMEVVINRDAEYIGEIRKAERLLMQGYELWRENNQEDHHLLSHHILHRIEPYLRQLHLDADKIDFIARSRKSVWRKKRNRVVMGAMSVILVAAIVFMTNKRVFLPLEYAQSELLELSAQNQNMKPETRSKIAKALFFVKNFEGAQSIINKIDDDWDKDVARSEIATAAVSAAHSFKEKAAVLVNDIQNKNERRITECMLHEIMNEKDDACGYSSHVRHSITTPVDLITSAEEYAAQKEIDPIEKLDVMAALAQAAVHRAESSNSSLPEKKVQAVLKEMELQLEIINNIPMDFRIFQGRRSAAEIAAYLGEGERAFEILTKAKEFAEKNSDAHERTLSMRSLAIAAAHFAFLMVPDCQRPTCDSKQQIDKLLKLAEEAKDDITEDGEKYAPLSSIVEAQVARAGISEFHEHLEKARNTAKEIHSKVHLSSALRLIVTEMVKRGHEREAVEIAEQNETDVKADLLATILLASTGKAFSLQGKNYRPPRFPQEANDDMVNIPAGHFTMGTSKGAREEMPAHTVYVDGFWLDSSETTVELYDKFLNETRRKQKPGYWKDEIPLSDREKPVIGVTWGEANAYCRWRQKRLPTEAEWEKAARGTDKRKYPWGNSHEDRNKPANYGQSDTKDPYSVLTKVGSFKDQKGDSPYGIHDMAGNAWEWVEDWYDGSVYVDIHSGGYPASSRGDVKILRGGSWDNTDRDDKLRSTFRLLRDPKDGYRTYGFRCARSIDTLFNDGSQVPLQR
ncbi:MAG: SUMF1/EgtB/PvdO family nonheme iron enzyme [Nitrospira sp.]|nr:SUMF1/EgtB/PvdO family nonheme iron enzyme [Nitrospira sp.]